MSKVEYIKYNLNYDTNNEATVRGVEGTIVPDQFEQINKFGGKEYVRRKLITGYCSGLICVLGFA
jgi:hypothetical protein